MPQERRRGSNEAFESSGQLLQVVQIADLQKLQPFPINPRLGRKSLIASLSALELFRIHASRVDRRHAETEVGRSVGVEAIRDRG